MFATTPQILIILLGLILVFAGLPIYRSALKVFGFIVGAAYGIYLFTIFAGALDWEPLFVLIAAAILVVILGVMGTFIAKFANALMFFLAGGLVGVILGKIAAGFHTQEIVNEINNAALIDLLRFKPSDILWFLGGGVVFIIALDILIMFALCFLGAGLIWYGIQPMDLMQPDWVIPLIIGILGLLFQQSMRMRARSKTDVPKRKPVRREIRH